MCEPCCRVFSLDPIEGYEPPTLSGHKDGIVGVFFSGPATRRAAVVSHHESSSYEITKGLIETRILCHFCVRIGSNWLLMLDFDVSELD